MANRKNLITYVCTYHRRDRESTRRKKYNHLAVRGIIFLHPHLYYIGIISSRMIIVVLIVVLIVILIFDRNFNCNGDCNFNCNFNCDVNCNFNCNCNCYCNFNCNFRFCICFTKNDQVQCSCF